MKDLVIFVLIGCAAYFGYQKYFANSLYGTYELDVVAMEKQLQDAGVSQSSIDAFRQQMGGGRTTTTISKQKISITINGQSVDVPYEIVSTNDKCTTLKGDGKVLEYCLQNGVLEVHNKRNAMFEVYRRI
jgi:hypothetical protein